MQGSLHCREHTELPQVNRGVHLPPPNLTVQSKLPRRNNERTHVERAVKDTVGPGEKGEEKSHPVAVTRGDTHNNNTPSAPLNQNFVS